MGPLKPSYSTVGLAKGGQVVTLCLKQHLGLPLHGKGASETLPDLVDEVQVGEYQFHK